MTKLYYKQHKAALADGLSFTEQVYRQSVANGRLKDEYESLEQSAWTFIKEEDTYKLIKKKPKVVLLKLAARPAGETNLLVLKTYRLCDKECALYVDYELINQGARTLAAGLWLQTRLRTMAPDTQESYLYILPTSRGLSHVVHPRGKPDAEYYYAVNPPLNWQAFVGLESRLGSVIVADYAALSCFRDRHMLNSDRS